MDRVYDSLLGQCPEELAALAIEDDERNDYEPGDPVFRHGPATSGAAGGPEEVLSDFALASLDLYQTRFDPSAIEAELGELNAEYDRLVDGWVDLPSPRAKERSKARLKELEARMDGLKQAGEDASAAVEAACRELHDLQLAIADARRALAAEAGEQALRRRAEAVRRVLGAGRIVVEFKATGRVKTGYKHPRSVPACIHFRPGEGRGSTYQVGGAGAGGATPADGGYHSSGLPAEPANS
jgi:hypothetical protein